MSHSLHLLLSAYACLPNKGTELGNGWNWPMRLAEHGAKVHVLTVTDGQEQIEAYRALHANDRVSFTYVPVNKRLRHTTGMHYAAWQWAAVKVARELHRQCPFDVVHHVTYSSVHVPTQLWRLGLPTVFGPVGGGQVAPANMLADFGTSQRAERLRTLFTRALPYSPLHRYWLSKMSLVLATNSDTLRLVKCLGQAKVEPWFDAALADSFFAPQPRQFVGAATPVRLLWVGKMLPRKALPLALDIMRAAGETATLTIAGGGLPEETVRAMIAERGLTARVSWSGGLLEYPEMRRAYLQHDALLFTSLRDSCPPQIVEAMGLGLPVLTLDHQGAHDLVPQGAGIKVPVTSRERIISDFAEAIRHYGSLSGAERSEMSSVGWSFARTLTYSAGAELFEGLYREILAGAPITSLPEHARSIRAVGA